MRLIFAGTPDFAVPALEALHEAGHEILSVLTQPDRPAGRGRRIQPTPVKAAAQKLGIPVLQPEQLRDSETLETLRKLEADLMVVVAYGMILPQALLDQPRFGCFNIHASLLPAWRGAAPIHRALAAGDPFTGITIMQMDATLDTGDILLTEAIPILATDTTETLHDRLSDLGAETIVTALELLGQNALKPRPQDHQLATYAHKLKKQEAVIDWTRSATEIANQVRAFNPWPVAQSSLNGTAWRIWAADPVTATSTLLSPSTLPDDASPGTILSCSAEGVYVATGEGVLALTRLQRPGGKPLHIEQLLNAWSFEVGDHFDAP